MKYTTVRYCGICGDLLTRDPRLKICEDPYCLATIMVYHDLLGGEQINRCKQSHRKVSPEETQKYANIRRKLNELYIENHPTYESPVIDHIEKDVTVTEDPRGIHNEEKQLVFSKSSAISCVHKVISTSTDKIGWTIQREKGESVKNAVIRMTRSDEKYLSAFDVIYAWKCGCTLRTIVTYPTLKDLPSRSGYYGECPRCRSHALCIEVES